MSQNEIGGVCKNILIHVWFCFYLFPFYSGFTALAAYGLTTELWNPSAGLLAACFIAIGESVYH